MTYYFTAPGPCRGCGAPREDEPGNSAMAAQLDKTPSKPALLVAHVLKARN